MTENFPVPFEIKNFNVVGEAQTYTPPTGKALKKPAGSADIHGTLSASGDASYLLRPGEHMAFRFDNATGAVSYMTPAHRDLLTETAREAVNKAPAWMGADLVNTLSRLDEANQDKWGRAILDASDPYIDEIAFSIAHSSTHYLKSSYASPELFTFNAELIYENDQSLKYVEVVDYGTSASDRNYYSTTRYRKAFVIDTSEVEVPRDIYYWYIVHPKITDEIPAFIDPEIIESNFTHNNNIVGPGEGGEFWRDFLYHKTALKILLKDCRIVWNGVKGFHSYDNHAIAILDRWLGAVMTFTSNDERPHQPVRIYTKHIGRCGENGDMRTAIARATLIPCTNVATYSTDHVWNEFWDEGWIHWDGGELNNPLVYESGWKKIHGSVLKIHSDGYITSVSDTYSKETGTMNLYILDQNGLPVDGAVVYLYMLQDDGVSLWFDNHSISDADGKVSFRLGTRRYYYGRVQSALGSIPENPDDVMFLRAPPRTDTEVNLSLTIEGAEKPAPLSRESGAAPDPGSSMYFLDIKHSVPDHVITGRIAFDDVTRTSSSKSILYRGVGQGTCDFFMVDEVNYLKFVNNETFTCFNDLHSDSLGVLGFSVPAEGTWYGVYLNNGLLKNLQHVVSQTDVYLYHSPAIPEVAISRNYPNPFNRGTTIEYDLPDWTHISIEIYNLLGQKVKTLYDDLQFAGTFTVPWDGTNDKGEVVSTGVYFVRLKTDAGIKSRKLVFRK